MLALSGKIFLEKLWETFTKPIASHKSAGGLGLGVFGDSDGSPQNICQSYSINYYSISMKIFIFKQYVIMSNIYLFMLPISASDF